MARRRVFPVLNGPTPGYFDSDDYRRRLAEIHVRAFGMMHYRFERGERVNAPGGCWPVRGRDMRVNGTIADHEARIVATGGESIRGPSAYFTAADDAESYVNMANDLNWLIRENEELRALLRSIGGSL